MTVAKEAVATQAAPTAASAASNRTRERDLERPPAAAIARAFDDGDGLDRALIGLDTGYPPTVDRAQHVAVPADRE